MNAPLKIIALLALLMAAGKTYSQDTLRKTTGEVLQVKVIEVGETEIKYKMFNYQEGPLFVSSITELKSIKCQNGMEILYEQQVIATSPGTTDANYMYNEGRKDARKYYTGYKTPATIILVASCFTFWYGAIPALIVSLVPPNENNLSPPDYNLFNSNSAYREGYRAEAKKVKSNKVWSNFAIGMGAGVAMVMILVVVMVTTVLR